ncbi:SUKH-4 family immunity protein [Paractinoplanes abujensis]|uniref:SUKH-4 family immunity protein n=1 Tax=Paractinoplanes abujensis TaxID=882441 RepID=UPI0034DB621E
MVSHAALESWAGAGRVTCSFVNWHVPSEAIKTLAEVGLPRLDTRFVPSPQGGEVPVLSYGYVLGREEVEEGHQHSDDCSECSYFAIKEGAGEVLYGPPRAGDGEVLTVNTSLRYFVYFLHKQGAASSRYSQLPEEVMMRRYERVVNRLKNHDLTAMSDDSSFWRQRFTRLWG